jgi:thiol:disulfide interchange protein DsbD
MIGKAHRALLTLVVLLTCMGVMPTVLGQSSSAENVYQLAAAAGSDNVRLTWSIADGHHLFANKFRFESATPGITLGTPRLPPSRTIKDDFLGDIQVYTDAVTVELPVTFQGTPPPAM